MAARCETRGGVLPSVLRPTHVLVVGLLLGLGGLRVAAVADEHPPAAVVAEAWERYRSVKTEREEVEILVIKAPQKAEYVRADADSLLRDTPDSVVHKRAVRHVLYAVGFQDKIHLRFSAPAEDVGLSFLVWRQPTAAQDGMWVFMPGYHNVRRAPLSGTESLAGTDLIYEDLRELAGERTEAFTYAAAPDESIDGRACDVVIATPKAETPSAYSRRKLWFDREWRFPMKQEFYDETNALWKVLRNTGAVEIAPGVRRPTLTEMRDLKANETTLLVVVKRAVGSEIPAAVFTQDHLMHPDDD